MTIEEIRTALDALITDKRIVQEVIDSIVQIRSDAYNEGWDDGQDELS